MLETQHALHICTRSGPMDRFMRDSDAFSWYMERDPVLRSTVVSVVWLDRSPDWGLFVRKMDRATHLVPVFRSRVVELPGRLSTPRLIADPEFDLDWHLRRVEAPPPHTDQVVVDFARREAMAAFDPDRPLWHFTLIEGLEGARAALVMKLHHSLTDGLGGMDLALLLFAKEPGSSVPAAPTEKLPAGELREGDLVREGVERNIERGIGFVARRARAALPDALHTARHPVSSTRAAVDGARSVYRTVAPIFRTLSP